MSALAGDCFHCATPIPVGVRFTAPVDGATREFCCGGCQAVAQSIVAAGLSNYYRQRSSMPEKSDAVVPDIARLVYDDQAVQATFVRELLDGEREAVLLLEGMTCAACAWLIEQRLRQIPGVRGASVNFTARRAHLRWRADENTLSNILQAVDALGYRAQPYERFALEAAQRREQRQLLWRVFVSGFASMQVMMYSIPVYIANGEMSDDIVALMRWAGLVLTLPVLLFAARPFFIGAWRDLRARRLGMDVPVALGIATAFVPSAWATWSGHGEVYFDAVSMFVFFLLGGRYLEWLARARAGDAIERLSAHAPSIAQRLRDFPASWDTEQIAVAQLRVGDLVLVKPGESVPADAVLVDGDSEVDESLLTGESTPVLKRTGARVIAGALNRHSPMVLRVSQIGADSTLSVLTRLLERAVAEKPRVVQLAERAASWFVASILLVAALVFFAWSRSDLSAAVWITVSVLVVTCPCALSLATPAALAAATHAAARRGILITRGHALETAAQIETFVFDKTGTLTIGQLQLAHTHVLGSHGESTCLAIAALMEAGSEHPIAKALRAAAQGDATLTLGAASEVRSTPAAGIEATVGGARLRLGTLRFVAELHQHAMPRETAGEGETLVGLGDESGWLALFVLRDRARRDAPAALQQLNALGCTSILLSGDGDAAVRATAAQLGISTYAAQQSPADKLQRMQALQQHGRVAMVGDGINDGPSLAAADLSIAMGSGTDLAHSAADVVLLSDRLDHLPHLVELGRNTRRIIRQNLAWAIGYNALAIPFAALGYVTPWMAGLGMAASSLLVVLNAARLSATPKPNTTAMERSTACPMPQRAA